MASATLENNISVLYDALDLGTSGRWEENGELILQRPPASAKLKKIKFRSFSANIKNNIQNIISPNLNCDLCCNIEILNETTTAPDSITTDELSSLPKKLLTTINDPQKNELFLLNQTGLKVFNNQYSNVLKLASYNIPLNNTIEESIDKGLTRAKVELMKLLGLIIDKESDNDNYEFTTFVDGNKPNEPVKITQGKIRPSTQLLPANYYSGYGLTGQFDGNDIFLNSAFFGTLITGSSYPYTFEGKIAASPIYPTGAVVGYPSGTGYMYYMLYNTTKNYDLPTKIGTLYNNTLIDPDADLLTTFDEYKTFYDSTEVTQRKSLLTASMVYNKIAVGDIQFYITLIYKGVVNNCVEPRRVKNIISGDYKFVTFYNQSDNVNKYEDNTEYLRKMLSLYIDAKYTTQPEEDILLNFCYKTFDAQNTPENALNVLVFYSETDKKLSAVNFVRNTPTEYGLIETKPEIFNHAEISVNTDFDLSLLTDDQYTAMFTPYLYNNNAIVYKFGKNDYYIMDAYGDQPVFINLKETINSIIEIDDSTLLTPYITTTPKDNPNNGRYGGTSSNGAICFVSKLNTNGTYDYWRLSCNRSTRPTYDYNITLDKEWFFNIFKKYIRNSTNPIDVQKQFKEDYNMIFYWDPVEYGELSDLYIITTSYGIPDVGTKYYTLSNSLLCVFDWNEQGVLSPYLPAIEDGSGKYNWINTEHIQPNGIVDGPQYIYYSADETDNFIENIFKWDQTTNKITFPNIPLVGRATSDGSKWLYGNLFFYITFSTSPEVISFDPNIKQGRLKDCSAYYSVYKQLINKTPSLYLQQYNFDDYFYINDKTYYDVLNTFLLLRNTDTTLKLVCSTYPTLNNIVFYLNETSMIDFKETESSPQEPNIKCKIVDAAGALLTPSAASKIYSNITICVDWEFYS